MGSVIAKKTVHRPQLAVIMPVYNEAEVIGKVIKTWHMELSRLGIDFELHLYNDGSTDGTDEELERMSRLHGVVVHNKMNSGHGPTILEGYLGHLDCEWIFQVDSDNEIDPKEFEKFWNAREKSDFVVGSRQERQSPIARRLITSVSRWVVRLFFGKGVEDVNAPFRLMRTKAFAEGIESLPKDVFAPNVALSGFAARAGLRIQNLPVKHQHRQTGEVSIKKWKLFKAAVKSFWQVILYRLNN